MINDPKDWGIFKMKPIVMAWAGLALAGCTGVAVQDSGPVEDAVTLGPTVPAVTSIEGVTPAALPQAVFQGPALDLNWTDRYQAGVAYVNTGILPVRVFSGPDGQDQIALLSPGNGGPLDGCAVEVNMCSITFGTARNTGWVFMDNMGIPGAPAPAEPTES